MKSNKQRNSIEKYNMSFTTGGLFYQESLIAAQLFIKIEDWSAVKDEILKSNLFQSRTVNSLKKVCREILSRLKLLSLEQIEILDTGTMHEQRQILWIAVCKRYSFIRDFAVEVVREKFLFMDYTLIEQDYNIFFDAKAEWHEELENLRESTRKKLRQVLFRMMREAEIISYNKRVISDDKTVPMTIIPSILSKRVIKALLNEKSGIYMILPVSETDFKKWSKEIS